LATVLPPYAWYIFAEKMMRFYGIMWSMTFAKRGQLWDSKKK
jgi:hypothetical protein